MLCELGTEEGCGNDSEGFAKVVEPNDGVESQHTHADTDTCQTASIAMGKILEVQKQDYLMM